MIIMFGNQHVLYTCLIVMWSYHMTEGQLGDIYRKRPTELPFARSCSTSAQCRTIGTETRFPSCCRDGNGSLVDGDMGWGLGLNDLSKSAKCSPQKGGPGEVCNFTCGCVSGYVCYRTVTGACCPPLTCWKAEDAQKDRDFWDNCKPPTCFFPPSAPPSGPAL